MVFLRLMLVLAIAASGLSAGESASASSTNDEHACCNAAQPATHEKSENDAHHNDCGGACLMVCCRAVTAPADPVARPLDASPLALRLVLPPLLARDLGEPPSIFHPPRA